MACVRRKFVKSLHHKFPKHSKWCTIRQLKISNQMRQRITDSSLHALWERQVLNYSFTHARKPL